MTARDERGRSCVHTGRREIAGEVSMEDGRIIDLYWAREETAIAETDKKYGNYCRSLSMRILNSREDSEECVNDTWLRAWDSMPPGRPSCLCAFLGKITRNLSISRWRKNHAGKRGSGETGNIIFPIAPLVGKRGNRESIYTLGIYSRFTDSPQVRKVR